MIHRAGAHTWGKSSAARLCEVIVASNDGMAQQVAENRSDLLDLLSTEELNRKDDLGLSLAYLAVYYDRPQMLEYLFKRGILLTETCDPLDYGNPMFYAITMKRTSCIVALDLLGCSIHDPCTKLGETAWEHAERLDDENVKATLNYLKDKEYRAAILFLKHYWRRRVRRYYLQMKSSILVIQCAVRRFIARRRLRKLRKLKTKKPSTLDKKSSVRGLAGKR